MKKFQAFVRELACMIFWHEWGEFIPSTSITLVSHCGGDRYRGRQQCVRCGEDRDVHFTVPTNP